MITRATVQNLLASHDSTLIDDRLSQINDIEELFLFIARYTSWNSVFGSGVSSLAGLIGQCRHLFNDPQEPIELFADRSVLIAS